MVPFIPDSRHIADASAALESARVDGYDFVTTALPRTQAPRPDATALTGRWWRTSVVGLLDEEDDETSPDGFLEGATRQLEWAIHMGIPAVILPPPAPGAAMEYAGIVQTLALEAQANNLQIWIRTHLAEKSLAEYELVQTLCDGLSNIGIMLVMDPIPTMASAAATVASQIVLVHKAIGANLRAVLFPCKVFLTNKRGYPALPKSHQVVFTEILKRIGRIARVIVEGPSAHEGVPNAGATKCLPYLQYIRHLREREEVAAVLDSEEAALETPYLDSLQRPLQPLKDHLEFSMYETFEKDPVKYAKYEEAVHLALRSGVASMTLTADAPKMITVAVAGAGRGPLVMRSIQAFKKLMVPPGSLFLRVFAIEKNPSAVIYLRSMAEHNVDWQGIVSVINIDARKLTLDALDGNRIDIVVSELLGSFGDNELSPECLDPLLESECCKSTTISIPMQCTTYLAPVSSYRLHCDAAQQALVPHDGSQPLGIQKAMETSYVVRPHSASQTHQEQSCWTFQHPSSTPGKERTATLEFAPDPTFAAASGCGYGQVDPAIAGIAAHSQLGSTSGAMTIHGLLGTFTAILYSEGDSHCEISIAPHRFSTGMFSWFPLYFPFRNPLRVPDGSNVSVKMWRKTSQGRVWYEWCAKVHRKGETLGATHIHNPNGRSSDVSM
jgi:type II protein arginine methyltransferase